MQQVRLWPLLILVAANLVPAGMVLWADWQVVDVLLLFWLENVIIGGFNVLKMLSCQPLSIMVWGARIFMTPFFVVHYGMFTLAHGLFLVAMFGGDANAPDFSPEFVPWVIDRYQLAVPALMLVLSNGVFFARDYLWAGGYAVENPVSLMMKPYGRVVILHVGIFLLAFGLLALGEPLAGLLLMILLKIIVDIVLMRRGSRSVEQRSAQAFPSVREIVRRWREHYTALMEQAEAAKAGKAARSGAIEASGEHDASETTSRPRDG